MKFKKPDLNAARFRKQRKNLLDDSFFKRIREEHPFLASITDKDIRKIIEEYNELSWKTALIHRDGVELPEQLGMIFIGACEPKTGANPDYKTSIDLENQVQHKNLNSDSFVAKIFYITISSKYRFRNHELWGFEGCRKFTRGCSEEFRKSFQRYVRIDKKVKVSTMFRSKPEKTFSRPTLNLDDYNELDL